ncbi:hypothetical protein Tco_1164391 [Tanacetum coccineum]
MLLNLWELSVIHSKINLRIYGIASSLSDSELNGFKDKMEVIELINRSDVQKNLYNALVEAYNTNKDLLSSYGNVIIIPTTRDDKDKDEEPSTRSNRGTKRRRSGKEAGHPNNQLVKKKRRRTTSSSKGLQISTYRLNETTTSRVHSSDENVIPARENNPEGMPYPHNLSKPLLLIPNARGRLVIPFDHFINNDLEYLKGGSSSRKYTTSITKTKAADYGQVKWIEDRIPRTTWSVVPIDYDKHEYWGKLTNLKLDDKYALNVALRMYTRRIAIQERMEDLQLASKSYQNYKAVRLRYSDPMIQPEPEGSTQGYPLVSVEVLRFYTSAGNPVKEILLKLNLPDHRILKDGGEVKEFQRSFCHSDTERLSRSDEVLKLKNFKKDATLKLSKSTNQEWYEHVSPEVTRSQDDKVTRWRNKIMLG